jgi:hypothetical protein
VQVGNKTSTTDSGTSKSDRPAGALTKTEQAMPPTVFIKTYGCQMNVSDTELVTSILIENGFRMSNSEDKADVILLNTCAIRDRAEAKIWGKLHLLKHHFAQSQVNRVLTCSTELLHAQQLPTKGSIVSNKAMQNPLPGLAGRRGVRPVVGLLGCMAERLKDQLLESRLVDIVAGVFRSVGLLCQPT